jgi:hypothetical protein
LRRDHRVRDDWFSHNIPLWEQLLAHLKGDLAEFLRSALTRPNKIKRAARAAADRAASDNDRCSRPERSAEQSSEKQDLPLSEADGEALFQNFVKWQLDRNLFGRP